MTELRLLVALVLVFSVTKKFIDDRYFLTPPLAAWELAAMCHVFYIALKSTTKSGYTLADPKWNSRMRQVVVAGSFVMVVIKLLSVCADVRVDPTATAATPLEKVFKDNPTVMKYYEAVSPFIIVFPLFFFLAVNLVAFLHVRGQQRKLFGYAKHDASDYLRSLIKQVDIPVVLPFALLMLYFFFFRILNDSNRSVLIGSIGCCVLIVSNILTDQFEESWRERERRTERAAGQHPLQP